MNVMNKSLLAAVCLLFAVPALAAGPSSTGTPAPLSEAERYARRCQSRAPDRSGKPQGTMLWGMKGAWGPQQGRDERRSVIVSVDLNALRKSDAAVKALRLVDGRLEASPEASTGPVGTVLQGTSSEGKPVEVAFCGAEPAPEDPSMAWYRIEAWNPVAQQWENPCEASGAVPDPRALAVGGVWDASGARQEAPGKFTLACENGVITKCIRWGYKPWASREGQSLVELHQACTRMARADYCGNGQSHTHEGTIIDMYDRLGLLAATTESSADWDLSRASFEAAWAPDGATCLSRTRDGRALETIVKECPGRFRAGAAVELGQGDRCTLQREGMSPGAPLLRNRSYESHKSAAAPAPGQ
ncbi:MAG: hypothetical protein JXB05_08260 [Myxococcaceae bacterium]|nr:hypothetical protein [Myxococcaceae bacterium]